MTFFYDSIAVVVVVAVLFCIFRHTNFHFAIFSLSQRKKSHFPNAFFDAPLAARSSPTTILFHILAKAGSKLKLKAKQKDAEEFE